MARVQHHLEDLGANPNSNVELMSEIGARVPFEAGEDIYSQGEPADLVYQILNGSVRVSRFQDGAHHVLDVRGPGALIGLDPTPEHLVSAEALTDCVVLVASRRALDFMCGGETVVPRLLGGFQLKGASIQ